MLTYKEHKGLYLPTVLDRKWKSVERRPGETWVGPSGTWFYKRPDGKVIRIEPPQRPQVPDSPFREKQTQDQAGRRIDRKPVELAKRQGISPKTLFKLSIFQINKVNQIREQRGLLALDLQDFRLKTINPEEISQSMDFNEEDITRIQRMARRINEYDPEFASNYAPVALDDSGNVMDGKLRVAAHVIAGDKEMLVLMPRKGADNG